MIRSQLILLALSLVAFTSLAAARTSLLFETNEAVSGDVPRHPLTVRERIAAIDLPALARVKPGDVITFILFDDVSLAFDVLRDRRTTRGGRMISGRTQGEPTASLSLLVHDGSCAGIIHRSHAGSIRIRSVKGNLVTVCELDDGAFAGCGTTAPAAPVADLPEGGAGCDDGSLIKVLVLYSTIARIDAGGAGTIENEIELAVELTNEAYINSEIDTQLELVFQDETLYFEEASYSDHLEALSDPSDGLMDEAHTLREEYDADLVGLIVADGEYCGLASLMQFPSVQFESHAFSVTTWYCAADNLTLAHELGHNMGCCHDPANCAGSGVFPYSFGHHFDGFGGDFWRTIMAYPPGDRALHFSNPEIVYDGGTTGVENQIDNARTISETAPFVASFRCDDDDDVDDGCGPPRLTASDAAADDLYGFAVDVDDAIAIVGAPMNEVEGDDKAGAAYILVRDGENWSETTRLVASDHGFNDQFARAVAIDANRAIAGAHSDDDQGSNAGAAYIFEAESSTWLQHSKLAPNELDPSDRFGIAVDLHGNVAIVGTDKDDDAGEDAGAAYVFRRTSGEWIQEAKLIPDGAAAGDRVGRGVSVFGEFALLGAWGDDDRGDNAGAAYVFRFDGAAWQQEAKLLADGGKPGDFFGQQVALHDDVAVIGAQSDDDVGAAYVFRRTSSIWLQEIELHDPEPDTDAEFGAAVSTDGASIIVGCLMCGDRVTRFVNEGSTWVHAPPIVGAGAQSSQGYGQAVAISGSNVVVGAPFDDAQGTDAGAVYAFDLNVPDCNTNGIADACDIQSGTSSDIDFDGIPDECFVIVCDADVDFSGAVGFGDLLALLSLWGPCLGTCIGDLDGSGTVDFSDLLLLLDHWGPCF